MTKTPGGAMLPVTDGFTSARRIHRDVIEPFGTTLDELPVSASSYRYRENLLGTLGF